MIYSTGTISLNGNIATGNGSNWTAPSSQVRQGQVLIVLSTPVQLFQINTVNSATELTVSPAAAAPLSNQKYGILVSDAMSLDGLAQAMSQLINEYDENIDAWETFALTTAAQDITVTINGQSVTIPSLGKLKDSISKKADLVSGAVAVSQGGTGATNAGEARANLGIGDKSSPLFASLELSAATPYIDFHYGSTAADYDVRVINDASNQLTISGSSGTASIRLDGVFRSYNNYVTRAISTTQAQMSGGFMDFVSTRTRILNQPTTGQGGFDLINLNQDGTAKCVWNLNNDGGIANNKLGAVAWQGSDLTLKNSVEDSKGGAEAAVERLMQIRSREFVWNNNGKKDRGFIAQEMLAIDPRYVNFTHRVYDEKNDPNDLTGKKDGLYGLSDRAIMADAIAVIQMQQKTIESMSGEIAELQARMKAIDGLDA